MNSDQISKVIEALENFRKNVPMYIGKVDVDLAIAWLRGFSVALGTLDEGRPNLFHDKVLEERGWRVTAVHYSAQMLKRGMTAQAIVDELFIIEIEVWKLVAKHYSPRQGWEEAFQAMAEAGDDVLLDGDDTLNIGP